MDSIDHAIFSFKRGKPNFKKGKKVSPLEIVFDDSLRKNEIALSKNSIAKLKADLKDIIYLSDKRWYLGGLRSAHFRLVKSHNKDDSLVLMSKNTLKQSYLFKENPVFAKKII